MKYRPGRVHALSLVALAVVGLALLALAEGSKSPEERYEKEKIEAAQKTQAAMDAIKKARLAGGLELDDVNDPRETGLIGLGSSPITTDRGSQNSKLRALDPNLAAVFVELLKGEGVNEGDLVGVGMTGAFPLLNAAMVIAIEIVGAIPVAITSVGSSTWGANDPDMTWLDMESVLEQTRTDRWPLGLITHRSVAASRGGGDDRGGRIGRRGRALVDTAAARNGVPLIDEPSLDESIDRRMDVYDEEAGGESYRAYVNIGGGLASIGSTQIGEDIKPGLWTNLGEKDFPRRGVIVRMSEDGAPVMHIPGPESFLKRYRMGDLSERDPVVGVGYVFTLESYNVPLAAVLAVLYGFLIFVVVRIDIKHYLFRRPAP